MVKNRKNKVLCINKYGVAGAPPARIADAQKAGEIAALLFGNNTTVAVAGASQIDAIMDAIDSESYDGFRTACVNAGLNVRCAAAAPPIDFEDLVERLWDATYGSLGPQSVRPCW